MGDWKQIARAYAKKVGAELLFVNENSFGIEYPDGIMQHIRVEDLAELLGAGDIDASTDIKADAEYGKNPTIPDERFEFKVWDPYMYDDIMEAIDNCCSSSMGRLYTEYFTIEGPYEERFDVIDVLKDFGVDWEE